MGVEEGLYKLKRSGKMKRSRGKKRNGHDRQFTWSRARERLGCLQTTAWELVKRAWGRGNRGFAMSVCVCVEGR